MAEGCNRLPIPVLRRLALGLVGFHYDRQNGAYRRDDLVIDEETLDAMTDEDFHYRLHALAEEVCMADQVIACSQFGYGPPAPGVTVTVERGQVFALQGHAGDQLLLERHYVRPLPDNAEVVRCEVCGTPFVEGLPEHMIARHGGGGKEAA
jgi:hypothetical protein